MYLTYPVNISCFKRHLDISIGQIFKTTDFKKSFD